MIFTSTAVFDYYARNRITASGAEIFRTDFYIRIKKVTERHATETQQKGIIYESIVNGYQRARGSGRRLCIAGASLILKVSPYRLLSLLRTGLCVFTSAGLGEVVISYASPRKVYSTVSRVESRAFSADSATPCCSPGGRSTYGMFGG
ncbi:hypothetical protein EVAR_20859_1 [Eumeta japonica]|uniref:Uncharacterized protein n=1 Tax=Eumeta variegata TaxID=151549 RepID=A0A4C1UF36_EUMVA|nr:hypothetical protein EVAR_20859_1 [Eumeta japonica]